MVVLWVASRSGPGAVAVIGLAMTVPRLGGLVAGVLVDRLDRRALLALVEGGRALTLLALAWMATAPPVPLAALASGTALLALGSSFFGPLVGAWVPELVPPEDLTAANARQQGVWQGSSLVGYLAGGAALAVTGAAGGLALAGGLLGTALVLALAVPRGTSRPAPEATVPVMTGGFRTIAAHPLLRVLVPAGLLFNLLFAPLAVGLVVLARLWHLGPAGYVGLEGAWALGNLAGSLAGRRWTQTARPLLRYGALGGIPLILGGVWGWPPAAAAALFLGGIGNLMLNASALTLVQDATPPALRGRVLGILFAMVGGAMPLGIALWGVVAATLPASVVLVAPGIASCLVAVLGLMPAVRMLMRTAPG